MNGAEANLTQSASSIDAQGKPGNCGSFASSIQPHGLLLVLSDPELRILQISANTATHLGVPPWHLLGQPLQAWLDAQSIATIRQGLLEGIADLPKLSILTASGPQWFDGRGYWTDRGILLELEPTQAAEMPLHRVRRSIAKLKRISHLPDFLQQVAKTVQDLTEFDRVMLYQFDAQGAGTVIAEAKRPDLLPSYLGLHYPATDIPEPVRALYRQGLLRYIPDLTAPAVELVSEQAVVQQAVVQQTVVQQAVVQQPIDLSRAILRSVDPCCVTYHQNMNVTAILVISLIKDQALWGLISCHHQTAKLLPAEVRLACELLGEFAALELSNKVDQAELDALIKLKALQSEFVESISQATDLKQALVNPAPRLLDLVNAEGAAVCLDQEITLVGATPTIEQIQSLTTWAAGQADEPLFHTDSLPRLYPEAIAFKETGSGLLRLRISRVRRYSILWFRPEVLQTIDWAGDPTDSMQVQPDGRMMLCPRQSFEQWQETVRLTSLPWKPSELKSAIDLRSAIVGIVLNKADELAQINRDLERSNRELDSFTYAASHDLKEPLRGIHNYSTLLLKSYANVLDEAGRNRLQTLLRLTRRMESLIDVLLKFSRLGQGELNVQPTDLNLLVDQVLQDLQASRQEIHPDIAISRTLPTVACDPVLMQEVLMNLLSNALKYTDRTQPWIEIGYLEGNSETATAENSDRQSASPVFYIRDNGIGIRDRHLETIFRLFKRLHEQHLYGGGTGTGLTIAKKIIERHGGQIWVESTYGEGSTFYFTLG